MRGQPLTQQREYLPDLRRVAPSERVTRARRVAVGECDHARRRPVRHAHARGLAFHQYPARRRHIHDRCCRTGQPNRLQHPRRRNRRPARARLRRIACRVGRAERGRPVRLARERISRQHQAHRAPRAILVQRVPVAVGALHPLRGQLAQHGLAFGRAGLTKPPADLRLVDPAGGCLRPPARRRVPEAIQDAQRIGRVARDEGEPLAHRLAPDLQGMGERGEIRVRIRAQPARKALDDQRQTLAIARRQHDQLSSRVVPCIAVARGEPVRRRLVHYEMGVGAAETKRIDRRAPQAARRYRPITQGRIDAERAALQQEMRVRRDEMNARRQLPMPQREQHLQQPGNTGRRERVADVALDRAERAAGARRGMRAERRRQRLELDRIAELSARAMRLDQADACRIDTEAPVHPGLQRGLGGDARRGDAVGPAVLVHAPAAQHAMHGIPIAQRIVEPLEQYHADALGRHESIRARIEAVAAAGRRQHAGVAGHDVQVRPGQHADTTGQREFAAALGEAVAGGRYGDQRRRARGVDRQARPLQVERIGDARGEDRGGGAHQVLRRQRRRRQAAVIVAVHAAREHAAGAAGKTPRIDAGRLHAGPRVLEEEPLLGIHRGGFHRRDAEEQRIEAIGLVEQAEPPARAAPGGAGTVAICLDIPARGRHLRHAVAAGGEVVPEARQIRRFRKSARHAHHGDPAGLPLTRRMRLAGRLRGRRRSARHHRQRGWPRRFARGDLALRDQPRHAGLDAIVERAAAMADHHLANMLASGDVAQRLAELLGRIDARDDRHQRPGLEQRQQAGQRFSPIEAARAGAAQIDTVERLVVDQPREIERPAGAQAVHGDLHITAGRREAVQAALDRVARQHVQHHVDAPAVGQAGQFAIERGTVIEHMFDADALQQRALGGSTRGAVHARAAQARQLDRGETAAAGGGLDQHALPGREPAGLEGVMRGQERDGKARGLLEAEPRRLGQHVGGRHHHPARQPAHALARQRQHGFANPDPHHRPTDGGHHARHLETGHERVSRLSRIKALHTHHVGEVERRGANLDQHLVVAGLAGRPGLDGQLVERVHGAHHQAVVARWQRRARLAGRRRRSGDRRPRDRGDQPDRWLGWPRRIAPRDAPLLDEMRGQQADRHMIVEPRRRQGDPVSLVDRPRPLDADDRIEAQLDERPLGIDLVGRQIERLAEAFCKLALENQIRTGIDRTPARRRCVRRNRSFNNFVVRNIKIK